MLLSILFVFRRHRGRRQISSIYVNKYFVNIDSDDDVSKQCGQELLHPQELELVASWSHKPNGAVAVLSRILRQVNMTEYVMVAVDEQIMLYVGLVAACERIKNTPIPHAYTR